MDDFVEDFANYSSFNSTEFNSTYQPTSFPTIFNWTEQPTSFPTPFNWTHEPTAFPTYSNITESPTMEPTANITYTFRPTSAPHSYDIVEDITNPKKFNFVALALSLTLLAIVVAVTLYGLCQRYSLVRKKNLAYYRYRRHRASTPDRLQMYFDEDVGSRDDINSFARGIYTIAPSSPIASRRSYAQVPTQVVTMSPMHINQ